MLAERAAPTNRVVAKGQPPYTAQVIGASTPHVPAAKKDITDRLLLSLESKPAAKGKRYIVWDAQLPHFGVHVHG